MRFYTRAHKHYCGIDLHARTMYLCILDAQGEILLHRNFKTKSENESVCKKKTAKSTRRRNAIAY